MATSRGKQSVRPVIVEVKPSNVAPSSPPSSPKAVRFAPNPSGLVSGISRELSSTEAWSLYHFETHARKCTQCYDPYAVYLTGGRLCDAGKDLAQDVAIHVYYKSGEVYYQQEDNHRLVRAEIQPGYDQVRGLLKGIDYELRSKSRTVPIVSYDRTHPVLPRRSSSPERRREERNEVIIEPGNSAKHRHSSGKTRRKEGGYKTQVVQESQPEAGPSRQPTRSTERRGSLYESDRNKKEKVYYVTEIREPEDASKRKKERRRSGTYA